MITLIAAIAENGVIGSQNKLPWHFREDLQNFKVLTWNNTVIMGRKTFESLGKPLPHRHNIIVSTTLLPQPGVIVCTSLNEAIRTAIQHGTEIFIIGGADIYRQALLLADRMILTRIRKEYPGDTFFPNINKADWKVVSTQKYHQFKIMTYLRNHEIPR